MNPGPLSRRFRSTRRQFLGRPPRRWAAWRRVVARPGVGACGVRAACLSRHQKAKRVIYLFQSAVRPSTTPSTTSRTSTSASARDARLGLQRPAPSPGMTSGQSSFPMARLDLQIPASMARAAHLGERTDAAPRGRVGRVVLHPLHVHRGDQSRSRDHVPPDRDSQIPGPPEHRRVDGYGLGSENENLPAFVARCHAGKATSRSTIASGARASCPRCTRACVSAPARIPCCT